LNLELKGKKALVTGSTAGIGFAIAKLLSQEGASVYINGRSQERVKAAIDKLRDEGATGELFAAPSDLAQKAGVTALLKSLPSVDILVGNLAIFEVKPFEEVTDEDWLRLFEANVLSGARLSRAFLPQMRAKNWGRMIFISSASAVNIPVEMMHYAVTKTAQLALARGIAEGCRGTGITVNSILPGPTFTRAVEEFMDQLAKAKGTTRELVEKDYFNTVRPTSLLQRFATAEEVAALAVFLCGPQGAAITGAALRADGGMISSVI
jgi:NAD(P)-dependent dehydrogenase (short-subunit alcohol dehydrogenase family)